MVATPCGFKSRSRHSLAGADPGTLMIGSRVFFFEIRLPQSHWLSTGFRQWVKVAKNIASCYTYIMGTWKSKNRHKYLLQYHIIFVCKYRKKLLVLKQISDDIKQLSYEICQRHKVVIKYMETDKDHIHYMIEMLTKYPLRRTCNIS